MKRYLGLLFVLVMLSGCSVGMAMSGQKDPDLGAVRQGATRGEVELHLGKPIKTTTGLNGSKTDVYEYEIGNEPSAGRAIGHGVMDILTLGIWEIVGTPVEGFQGDTHQITIVYNAQDQVEAVRSHGSE